MNVGEELLPCDAGSRAISPPKLNRRTTDNPLYSPGKLHSARWKLRVHPNSCTGINLQAAPTDFCCLGAGLVRRNESLRHRYEHIGA